MSELLAAVGFISLILSSIVKIKPNDAAMKGNRPTCLAPPCRDLPQTPCTAALNAHHFCHFPVASLNTSLGLRNWSGSLTERLVLAGLRE